MGAPSGDRGAIRTGLAQIPLYEQTLADRVWVLGADHPDTLASRSYLAFAYESAGGGTRRSRQ